ncbi:class III signal peptide-containing protein [Methanothermococcus sp. SCGC AD-155-C09]|nr:class III signal peptide-containing protein [Methanothermococcus sp. SCGC AD-155-C09]
MKTMVLEKLTSKKGQISMEMSILVAAAVAVASIAAFFYVKNVRNSVSRADQASTDVINKISETASNYAGAIPTDLNS